MPEQNNSDFDETTLKECSCAVLHSKDADGLEIIVDPDQTAPLRSSLIWVCTVCSDLSVGILTISMLIMQPDPSICKINAMVYETNPGHVAQSVGHLTRKSEALSSIPGLAIYFRFSFR